MRSTAAKHWVMWPETWSEPSSAEHLPGTRASSNTVYSRRCRFTDLHDSEIWDHELDLGVTCESLPARGILWFSDGYLKMSYKLGWNLGAIGSPWILGLICGYVVQSHNVLIQICAAKECKRELNPSKKAPGNVRQEESFLFQAQHKKEICPDHYWFYVSWPGMNSKQNQTSLPYQKHQDIRA